MLFPYPKALLYSKAPLPYLAPLLPIYLSGRCRAAVGGPTAGLLEGGPSGRGVLVAAGGGQGQDRQADAEDESAAAGCAGVLLSHVKSPLDEWGQQDRRWRRASGVARLQLRLSP